MTIHPLYDRIVVKRIEDEQQMHGGLHIPEPAQEKPQEARRSRSGRENAWKTANLCPWT